MFPEVQPSETSNKNTYFKKYREPVMTNILQKIGTAVTIVIALIALFILGASLPKVVPCDDLPFGWYTFRIVTSGSMEPKIPVGSIVASYPTGEYDVGDVITFTSEKFTIPTTHRIASVDLSGVKPVFTTKGDANEEADYASVSKSQILGEVFLTVPYAGYLAHFVSTPRGTWSVFWIIVLIFAGWFGIDIFRKRERKNENKSGENENKDLE